jgi:hypothetical protein
MHYKTGRNLFDVEKGYRPRTEIPGFEFVIGYTEWSLHYFATLKPHSYLCKYEVDTFLRLESCMPMCSAIT